MAEDRVHPELFIRLFLSRNEMIGPGKARLLQLIDETGSISAAGRAMGMSYKRAWSLVETMNAMFSSPLVESSRGGTKGGGAALTDTGAEVLRLYRLIEEQAASASATSVEALKGLMGQ